MKDMPVNKLMIQMGIPMILSMALQAVYNIVDSAFVGNMKAGSETAENKCFFYTIEIFLSRYAQMCNSSHHLKRWENSCYIC